MSLDNEGFRKRIKEYRIHFQLTQQEVATFMGWAQADYSNLENGKRIVDLDTVNLIASIYGFKGWQFARADTTIPKIENLPKETRTLVEEKLASGRTVRNTTVQLPKEIKKVLVSGNCLQSLRRYMFSIISLMILKEISTLGVLPTTFQGVLVAN
ncbi:helix-turn-helix domain-containing protein [Sphingobacterium sp. E70]|uniref:helix-turn-helix domain-containing protein n=1 Tax=Sphingobacterium sp. E70 TaxID=2853439 RepID=UPI00211B9725|nr:helix-turn-helix transcriptional regulator [Sphingobacterium sp. E70]ULT23545.1 helix-turn-helix domain-containing protein [Sphingobacterium sp. E70]